MKTSDFYYDLPKDLIAQTPISKRDLSRLLILEKESGNISHKHFYDIVDYLMPGDCLILNDSRVLPARIFGTKDSTHGKLELLLLKSLGDDVWQTMVRPGRKAKEGDVFYFADGVLKCEILKVLNDGIRNVKFFYEGDFYSLLDKIGHMPLPPYIKKTLADKERYQTVYSLNLGSAAAPTAGLHFTDDLLEKIKSKGIQIGFVTLHVGLGTFKPVKVQNVSEHKMHSEYYSISKSTADIISKTKAAGGRVFAVGTTSCRTLEAAYKKENGIKESCGFTDIFIYPGFKFNVVDAMITNFHLPESTLMMLVCAFAGRDNIMNAYNEAVREKYRFFSFGDAMLIK